MKIFKSPPPRKFLPSFSKQNNPSAAFGVSSLCTREPFDKSSFTYKSIKNLLSKARSAVPTAELGRYAPTGKLGRYAPTGKLGHSNIKFEASHPNKIKKRSTENKSRLSVLFLKTTQKPFCKKVFGATFFQKGSAVPTAKLGHSAIKLQAAYPYKIKTLDD